MSFSVETHSSFLDIFNFLKQNIHVEILSALHLAASMLIFFLNFHRRLVPAQAMASGYFRIFLFPLEKQILVVLLSTLRATPVREIKQLLQSKKMEVSISLLKGKIEQLSNALGQTTLLNLSHLYPSLSQIMTSLAFVEKITLSAS